MGERIRDLRIDRNMTQEELAEKCGLSRVFINRIENGKANKVMIATAFAIADALGVSVDVLFR